MVQTLLHLPPRCFECYHASLDQLECNAIGENRRVDLVRGKCNDGERLGQSRCRKGSLFAYLVGKGVRYADNFSVCSQDESCHFIQRGLDTSALVRGKGFQCDFPDRVSNSLEVNSQIVKGRDGQ